MAPFDGLDISVLETLLETIAMWVDILQVLIPAFIVIFCVASLAAAIVFGVAARRLAAAKGHKRSFFWGFFFGVFALIYMAGLPVEEGRAARQVRDALRQPPQSQHRQPPPARG